MAAQQPPDDTEDLLAVARELRVELHKARTARLIKSWVIGVTAVVLLAFIIVFGLSLVSVNSQSAHLRSVASCLDNYDNQFSLIIRTRAQASRDQAEDLSRLFSQVLHVKSAKQFRDEINAYEQAVNRLNQIKVPSPPPAACR